jgi:hypothetical protein
VSVFPRDFGTSKTDTVSKITNNFLNLVTPFLFKTFQKCRKPEQIKMMNLIKNKYLKSEFEQYQKLSTKTEKQKHLDKAKAEFSAMSEAEKETIREGFKANLVAINGKLQEIDKEIQSYKNTMEVYPKNEEEVKLLEMVLKKMGIGFALR